MTVEEKAKQYADWVIHAIGHKQIISSERIANDFTAGYTQAVTDLSAENAQLREALRELVESLDGWHHENMGISVEMAKAKQLLTDNTQEK